MFRWLLKFNSFLEILLFDFKNIYSLSVGLTYVFISFENRWEKIMENILIAIIVGAFVALLFAFVFGLIWLIVSLIIEVLSEVGKNSSIYLEHLEKENNKPELDVKVYKTKKRDNKFRDGLLVGLLLGWFFFNE